ncbi:unnamed protein product [Musa banksii]
MGRERKWEAGRIGNVLAELGALAEVQDACQFRLSDNADLDSVSTKLEDGVLTLALPKLAPEKIRGPRVVSIAGGDKEKLQGSSSKRLRRWISEGPLCCVL